MEANPIPLDVATGVTQRGDCMTRDGPTIQIYLQKHPDIDGRFVNLMVMENYLSREFCQTWEENIEEMTFQEHRTNAYLRVSFQPQSKLPSSHRHLPLLTVGRNVKSCVLYEAAAGMTEFLALMRDMSNKVIEWYDDAIADVSSMMVSYLKEKGKPYLQSEESETEDVCIKTGELIGKGESYMPSEESETEDAWVRTDESDLFTIPRQLPIDAIVSQATNNAPFNHHSDSQLGKEPRSDLVNDEYRCSEQDQLGIVTHRGVYLREGESAPGQVITMRHGIPRGERLEPDYCKLFGCFSGNGRGSFTPLINNSNEPIPIGGELSMH